MHETPRWLMPLVVGGFLVSGMAGLVDEVVWSRFLPLLIGGTTLSHTIVLATFMGGLALGNWVLGRRADLTDNPLRLYALLELGVGCVCIFFPEIFALAGRLYLLLASPFGFAHPVTISLKIVLAVSVVLLPTFLMGGTLPALARVLVKDLSEVTVSISRLYTINSLGAVAGVALGGFALVPMLGLDWTIRFSGALNLVLAAVFLLASRRLRRLHGASGAVVGEPSRAAEMESVVPVRSYSSRQQRIALVCIGIAGAASMVYEVVWTRLLTLVMGSSTFSFTIMLLTFISGITLGAWTVGRLVSERRDAMMWFAMAEIGVFASIVPVLPLYDQVPVFFSALAARLDHSPEMFSVYLALKIAIAFGLMLLPTFCIGMTLPLASRIAVDDLAALGRRVGSVFSINTVGTVVGASVTGLVLIPLLELRATLEIGLVISASLGILLVSAADVCRRHRLVIVTAIVGAMAVVLMIVPPWDQLTLHFGLYRHTQIREESPETIRAMLSRFRVEYAHHGVDTSVSVIRDLQTNKLYQKANGKTEAGTGVDMATQLWLGHVGMLLKPEAKKVAVVGLGSGITVAAALSHPEVEADVVEISRSMVESAQWFAPFNDDVLNNPRMRLHIGDAKEFFNLRANENWDVIVSQPSNPWISGVGNLFSVELFEQMRGNLGEDGLLVQWMQLYELDDDLTRITLNTLGSVFDYVEVWKCNVADVLLVASERPIEVDVEAIDRCLSNPSVLASLNRPESGGATVDSASFLLHQVLSAERFRLLFPGEAPLNSDRRPVLEYRAPRAFFAGARTALLQRVDERLAPLRQNRTHLNSVLGGAPPSVDQVEIFVRELEARRGPTSNKLLRSLAWMYRWNRPQDLTGRRLFNRYVEPQLAESLEAADQSEERWLQLWARAVSEATSGLHQPDASGFVDQVDGLVSRPAKISDAELVAAIWRALYGLGELERIAEWPQPLPPGEVHDFTGWAGGRLPLADLQDLLVGVGEVLAGDQGGDDRRLQRFLVHHPGVFPAAQLARASRTETGDGAQR